VGKAKRQEQTFQEMTVLLADRGFWGPEGQLGLKFALAAVFLAGVGAFAFWLNPGAEGLGFLIAAAVIGGYMALNIGANDVANNIGPAVGSRVITMVGALMIAAVFETAGAIIAGGDVVATISKGIIDPSGIAGLTHFVLAMTAALLAGAVWINAATWLGAPVSTTHSIVGGVLGAGIAVAGTAAVNWPTMGAIALSWVVSPLMGGLIAAGFLFFIKITILYREDRLAAARKWVPMLIGIMSGSFAVYLAMKIPGFHWKPAPWQLAAIGLGFLIATALATRPLVERAARALPNDKKSVNRLFTLPLIFAAALLSFAHGANDVANAVGPLAAIVSVVTGHTLAAKVAVPLWVMLVGAFGLSVGLLLYGSKIVRRVGKEITKMNPTRAFCVALAAAITVIAASWLGLPVSSTHTAVGAVFGVGFLREYIANRRLYRHGPLFEWAAEKQPPSPEKLAKWTNRKLVRRRHLFGILAAWLITVPASAGLAAILFLILDRLFA
jgi:inorganic phosphate transporter, PiT family